MLGQMKDDFEAQLADSQKTEASDEATYKKLVAAKNAVGFFPGGDFVVE